MSTTPIEVTLAARIKAEREGRGWSLAELARRADVSKAMISKVERGESSPTAALLGKLAGALGVTMSQLFSAIEEAPNRLSRRIDQPVWVDPAVGFVRRTLTPTGSGAGVELVHGDLPPGAEIAYPAAAFSVIDQQIVVLDGRLTFTQGATVYELDDGDCLHLGPPADCRFANRTRRACRYIVATVRLAP